MYRTVMLSLATISFFVFSCKKSETVDPQGSVAETDVWKSYTTLNSSLPSNQVNAIAVDVNDIKWIGTADGLARLEQDSWVVYNDKNSPLPSSFIQTIALEDNGTIWVGTNKGLAKFDGTTWTVWTTSNSSMSKNAVMSLAWDQKGKNIWAGFEGSFIRIDAEHNMTHYDDLDDLILTLAVDSSGALWMGTFNHFAFRGRLKRFDQGHWQNYNLDDLGYPSAFPYSLVLDPHQQPVVLLTGTSVKNLLRLNDGLWEPMAIPEDLNAVKTLLSYKDQIWIGGDRLSVLHNNIFNNLPVPATHVQIQAIGADSKGSMWVGLLQKGLVVLQKR